MSDFKVRRGYDVPLVGAPEGVLADPGPPAMVSLRPGEFRGVKPKVLVSDGDAVKLGQPLFHDRKRPEVRFPSPGGGEIAEVRYGKRRVCEQVFVRLGSPEPALEFRRWSPGEARGLTRAQILEALLDSGLWTSFRQRPFSVIPDPATEPHAVFVAASDSGPLAFDNALALEGREEDFQLGVHLLGKLTSGGVHVCVSRHAPAEQVLSRLEGFEMHRFSGPYPSGQIEMQIHHALPHKKDRTVWYLDCQDAAGIGELFRTGRYPVTRVVAVGGENASVRKHFRTRRGVSLDFLMQGKTRPALDRVVSGNVLAGARITAGSALGHYDNKFSVIPEGAEPEFVGWMRPGFGKVSRYRAYASAVAPPQRPHLTANLGGGVRAHVATGIYEDVCAADILPAYLMKSIVVEDFEEMEALGLHDCTECGLCTYVCPSKIEFGEIIAEGIEKFLAEEETA